MSGESDDDLIRDIYAGDRDKYEAEIKEGVNGTIFWNDIETSIKLLPGLEVEARDLIEKYLGYLPYEPILIQNESFVRSLIDNYKNGILSERKYLFELTEHVKQIRNQDMRYGGWAEVNSLNENDIFNYNNIHSEWKDSVRYRICNLLGFEPALIFSLGAELFMREFHAKEDYLASYTPDFIDYKAMAIVHYKKIKFEQDEQEADSSKLVTQI